ncbi:MAG: EAL domain-containing protein [Pseudomonadota bacterium]
MISRASDIDEQRATPTDDHVQDRTYRALRNLHVPVWIFDMDNKRIVFANAAALQLWDAETEADLSARDLSQGMSAAVARRLRQYQRDFLESAATYTEDWTLYPKGKPVALKLVYSGYRMADGRMAMMCEVINQVSDDSENLRKTDALLHADVMVTMFEEDGPPIYFNPAARKSMTSASQLFRSMFVEPEDYDDIMFEVHSRGEHRTIARIFTAAGETWHDLSVRRCSDPATGHPAILVTAFDVTELKTARDKARHLAETDPLTNCHNRNYLNQRLDQLMQSGAAGTFGLLYFDLDRFKQINDVFGHDVGDTVLKEAANRIQAQLRFGETLARLGGDEFVLLVEHIEESATLLQRAEDIRAALGKPIQCGETRLTVTTSIGAALVAEDVTDWSEAMRRADIALYHSKTSGRDRCSLFTRQMGRETSERTQLENDLADAIRSDQFILLYQPRINLASGLVESVEALVRWQHPVRGLIAPGAFIPLCEETGMIDALGEMIIRKACGQAGEWHAQGYEFSVSMNVSPRQFEDAALIDTIQSVTHLPGLRPEKIEFEITESLLVGDDAATTERLKTIQSLGFRIAADDFGTGYSNLANISRFPLQSIKIDKSFVDQLPDSKPIIQLIVTLAHQIGARIVAEGAETIEQVRLLKSLGCEQVQGFYFSRPVSAQELFGTISKLQRRAREL